MANGKGSGRRPAAITPAEETVAWAVAFGKPICPDCTAGARNLPEMWSWEPCARHCGPQDRRAPPGRRYGALTDADISRMIDERSFAGPLWDGALRLMIADVARGAIRQ